VERFNAPPDRLLFVEMLRYGLSLHLGFFQLPQAESFPKEGGGADTTSPGMGQWRAEVGEFTWA